MKTSTFHISVAPGDLGTMLICSLRYAIGRRSYMPSLIAERIRTYWNHLSEKDREVLYRDLSGEIRAADSASPGNYSGGLGMDCDERTWRDLLAWMKDHKGSAA